MYNNRRLVIHPAPNTEGENLTTTSTVTVSNSEQSSSAVEQALEGDEKPVASFEAERCPELKSDSVIGSEIEIHSESLIASESLVASASVIGSELTTDSEAVINPESVRTPEPVIPPEPAITSEPMISLEPVITSEPVISFGRECVTEQSSTNKSTDESKLFTSIKTETRSDEM